MFFAGTFLNSCRSPSYGVDLLISYGLLEGLGKAGVQEGARRVCRVAPLGGRQPRGFNKPLTRACYFDVSRLRNQCRKSVRVPMNGIHISGDGTGTDFDMIVHSEIMNPVLVR